LDIKETGCEGVEWIHLAQDRDKQQTKECDNEYLDAIKCGKFLDWLRICSIYFSRWTQLHGVSHESGFT